MLHVAAQLVNVRQTHRLRLYDSASIADRPCSHSPIMACISAGAKVIISNPILQIDTPLTNRGVHSSQFGANLASELPLISILILPVMFSTAEQTLN